MIIKPPNSFDNEIKKSFSIFLAGSIELNTAEKWQEEIEKKLNQDGVLILNPRRDDWDSSWEQKIENKQFREQVEWELSAQEQCDLIIMNFDPKTKSPITLLELGLFAKTGKLLVHCPTGFWRKGNVDIVCNRYKVKEYDDLNNLITSVKETLKQRRTLMTEPDIEKAKSSLAEEDMAVKLYEGRLKTVVNHDLKTIFDHLLREEKEHIQLLKVWMKKNNIEV